MIGKPAVFAAVLSATLGVSAAALAATSNQAPAKALVFPTGTDPHFYRQGVTAPCDSGGTCTLGFDKIPANHFLQIDKITCQSGSIAAPVLYRGPEIVHDAAHIVAFLEVSSTSGPFYMAAGEKPTIQKSGNNSEICSIFGTLWTAQ